MTTPLLTTKLYIPPVRRDLVPRPRLLERLNAGPHLGRKLTLISAPAGFGKTTLVSEWVQAMSSATPPRAVVWLSLDEGDNDLARFLAYFIVALQKIEETIGEGALRVLYASQPQPPPMESILTSLLNEITILPDRSSTGSGRSLVFVLDDYHVIESQDVDKALAFTLDHLPPRMHLVIASRIDPTLPLSRLRASGQMTEIREDDLRFSLDEINTLLDEVMGLDLPLEKVTALETRTEGWIAGLQLAALSMQGLRRSDEIADFVDKFTGSDRYIQDYLTDEVLRQRPKGTEDFLLQTSILNRLSGPLCDAVRFGTAEPPSIPVGDAVRFGTAEPPSRSAGTFATQQRNSQAILEALDAANLFIVPLDNERRWYRYHQLFADLLRQRLHQDPPPLVSWSPPIGEASPKGGLGTTLGQKEIVAELHRRASTWYEENGLEIDAFRHAAAANDIERAARLIEGDGMPLTFRGALAPVMNWLESLPKTVLDRKPLLWVTYASAILAAGQTTGVEQKLQAAESALQDSVADTETRDLIGRIAATRATLAWGQNQAETIIAQSRRALEYLHPNNLPFRTSTNWKLGYAYQLQGDRAAASDAYTETIAICQESGNIFINVMASTGLGGLQEAGNQLYLAAETYRRILRLVGDRPLLAACGAHLGLGRVLYEWNDLDAAQQHGQKCAQLAQHIDSNDAFASCALFLARLKLTQGDVNGAAAVLTKADQFVREHNFVHRIPDVAAAQVLVLLRQGNHAAAAHLAQTQNLPIGQARVYLAQGDSSSALAVLEPLRQQAETKGPENLRLRVTVLQAVAYRAHGEKEVALKLLDDALALAEPGGFIRAFVDEGIPMAQLLSEAAARGMLPGYTGKLLAAFSGREQSVLTGRQASPGKSDGTSHLPPAPLTQPLIEPLSQRELEVLQLIARGFSNREIGERLFLALSTVKGHNRNIYGKLQVQRRTEAVARARELGLL